MPVKLEEMGSENSDEMAEIFLNCLKIQYVGILPSEVIDGFTLENSKKLWQKSTANSSPQKFIGAFLDQELVGFAKYGPLAEDPSIGFLASLYVSPLQARKGIGREILEAVIRELDSLRQIQLWVFAENQPAISLYSRFDFYPTGITRVENEWKAEQIQLARNNL
jgi:ribosomal protein S18 acetylase RimI-like enzyme